MFKNIASGLFKLGEQAVSAGVAALGRLANRQEFEAAVACTVLIASADGTIDKTEKVAAIQAITAHPDLKGFDAAEVQALFGKYVELLGEDRDMAVEGLLGIVRKVTDAEARIRIAGIATKIANADGDYSAAEKAMVARIKGETA